jgi:plastocyanin
MIISMKKLSAFLFLFPLSLAAQTTHDLIHTNDLGFQPDTLYIQVGDSVHLTFDSTGHNMIQVPLDSWMAGQTEPHIGIAVGEGTINPGLEFTFGVDSAVTIYYLCEFHPNEEKGVIFVGMGIGISERDLPGFDVYPQPANDVLKVRADLQYLKVQIEDANGRIVSGPFTNRDGTAIDVSGLPNGIHFITLLDDQGKALARERCMIVH